MQPANVVLFSSNCTQRRRPLIRAMFANSTIVCIVGAYSWNSIHHLEYFSQCCISMEIFRLPAILRRFTDVSVTFSINTLLSASCSLTFIWTKELFILQVLRSYVRNFYYKFLMRIARKLVDESRKNLLRTMQISRNLKHTQCISRTKRFRAFL